MTADLLEYRGRPRFQERLGLECLSPNEGLIAEAPGCFSGLRSVACVRPPRPIFISSVGPAESTRDVCCRGRFARNVSGLLASFSFTLLFSTFSLIAGRAVDVISRKAATIGPCLVWSAMAAGTAFATGFPEVFALRVVQGSAQAFTVRGRARAPR